MPAYCTVVFCWSLLVNLTPSNFKYTHAYDFGADIFTNIASHGKPINIWHVARPVWNWLGILHNLYTKKFFGGCTSEVVDWPHQTAADHTYCHHLQSTPLQNHTPLQWDIFHCELRRWRESTGLSASSVPGSSAPDPSMRWRTRNSTTTIDGSWAVSMPLGTAGGVLRPAPCCGLSPPPQSSAASARAWECGRERSGPPSAWAWCMSVWWRRLWPVIHLQRGVLC